MPGSKLTRLKSPRSSVLTSRLDPVLRRVAVIWAAAILEPSGSLTAPEMEPRIDWADAGDATSPASNNKVLRVVVTESDLTWTSGHDYIFKVHQRALPNCRCQGKSACHESRLYMITASTFRSRPRCRASPAPLADGRNRKWHRAGVDVSALPPANRASSHAVCR